MGGGGGGLVTLVTRLVKSPTLPITFCDMVCMPTAMEAAKSEPGRLGTDGMLLEDVDGVEVDILPAEGIPPPKVGS